MKTGEAVLFRGAPEDGNLHGVAGVKDEPPPEDLRARCEAVARRYPKPGTVVAETRAPTVWAVWKSTSELGYYGDDVASMAWGA